MGTLHLALFGSTNDHCRAAFHQVVGDRLCSQLDGGTGEANLLWLPSDNPWDQVRPSPATPLVLRLGEVGADEVGEYLDVAVLVCRDAGLELAQLLIDRVRARTPQALVLIGHLPRRRAARADG